MKSYPKISIVVPSLNKGRYIEQTLQSIIDQKYPNLEVIIKDGGSSDNSFEIINKFIKKYKNTFKLIVSKDKGQWDAINKGFSMATGDLLGFINADDMYAKKALINIVKAYSANPDNQWFAGEGKTVDEMGRECSTFTDNYKNWLLKQNRYKFLLAINYLFQPSVFITKKCFKKYGPFVGEGKYAMEYDMWLKIAKTEMPTLIQKVVSEFRLTREGASIKEYRKLLKADEKILENQSDDIFANMVHYVHNIARIIIVYFFK